MGAGWLCKDRDMVVNLDCLFFVWFIFIKFLFAIQLLVTGATRETWSPASVQANERSLTLKDLTAPTAQLILPLIFWRKWKTLDEINGFSRQFKPNHILFSWWLLWDRKEYHGSHLMVVVAIVRSFPDWYRLSTTDTRTQMVETWPSSHS